MPHHGMLASQSSRLEALKTRHSALSHRVEKEQQSAAANDSDIKEWKRQKLLLKDEISELEKIAGSRH